MRFDVIVFDSGGTLFENSPERRAADEPTRDEVWEARFGRVAGCLQGLDLVFDSHGLKECLLECEATVPAEFGVSYSHEKLMLAALEQLHLPAKPAWACLLADAYAGPRYHSWLFAGVPEMLEAIDRMGLEMHLAVNTDWCSFSMERALRGVGLLRYFGTRTYSNEVGLAKPDPRFFRLVEQRACIAGRRILYVGDSVHHDIEGAKAAGWSAALRLNDQNQREAGLADYTFHHSPELVAWLRDN